MALVKCEICGKDISDKATVCPRCGTPREVVNTISCTECGAVIPVGATECPVCGCPVEITRETPTFVQPQMKFCPNCAASIPAAAVICTKCGCQVGQMKTETPNIVITNTNVNTNTNTNTVGGYGGTPKNKWVALCLCAFGGFFGAHKFYEGKAGTGLLYLCTMGLFGFGWLFDCFNYLLKPNPYYV